MWTSEKYEIREKLFPRFMTGKGEDTHENLNSEEDGMLIEIPSIRKTWKWIAQKEETRW